MSGEDGGLLRAVRTGTVVDGEEVDLGLVGEVVGVNPEGILDILAAGRIPVISTVAPEIVDDGSRDAGTGRRRPRARCSTSTRTPRRPPSPRPWAPPSS